MFRIAMAICCTFCTPIPGANNYTICKRIHISPEYYLLFISGKPAQDVSKDATPISAAVPITVFQSTCVIIAAAGSIATAPCAIVFTARIPAALNHAFPFFITLLLSITLPV